MKWEGEQSRLKPPWENGASMRTVHTQCADHLCNPWVWNVYDKTGLIHVPNPVCCLHTAAVTVVLQPITERGHGPHSCRVDPKLCSLLKQAVLVHELMCASYQGQQCWCTATYMHLTQKDSAGPKKNAKTRHIVWMPREALSATPGPFVIPPPNVRPVPLLGGGGGCNKPGITMGGGRVAGL